MVHAALVGWAEHDYSAIESMRTYSRESAALLDRLQGFVALHSQDLGTAARDDIVHCDFSPANTLISRGEVTEIVDREGVRAGDRVF